MQKKFVVNIFFLQIDVLDSLVCYDNPRIVGGARCTGTHYMASSEQPSHILHTLDHPVKVIQHTIMTVY